MSISGCTYMCNNKTLSSQGLVCSSRMCVCMYGVRNGSCFDYISSLPSCWLSSGDGTYAIWTFVAPMLAIIIVSMLLELSQYNVVNYMYNTLVYCCVSILQGADLHVHVI